MYRSYKKFDENECLKGMSLVPFHVAELFDSVDDSYCSVTVYFLQTLLTGMFL